MADDIGRPGEDPRDVARRRRSQGIRYRAAQAAANQPSGPAMTPPTQAMVPYREQVPSAPQGGGRGGPPAVSGGREMTAPRGENLPAVRREGMPAIRVPQGSAEMLRGAMQSPMARAMGTGRGAALGRVAQGAGRIADALMRGGRSPAARAPADMEMEVTAEPLPPEMTPGYEESMYAGSTAGRQRQQPARQQPARRPASGSRGPMRQGAEPEGTEAAAAAERERQRAMTPAEERSLFERLGLRRTYETGLEPGTEARMRDMYGSQYSSQYNMKQGGKVKAYREGGAIRQGMQSPRAQEARSEMAEDVMRRERAREPISDKERKAGRAEAAMDSGPLTGAEKERMRSSGFKKGGMIKPKVKTAMKKGGVVKKAAGGKVAAPKKMMKGGMTSKPKKMMGGGRAMYAKGGMAKGCK